MKKIISNSLVSLSIASAITVAGASPALAEPNPYGPLTAQPAEITRSPEETFRVLNNFAHFLGISSSETPEQKERMTLREALEANAKGTMTQAEVSKLIKEELLELLLTPSPS